MSTLEELKAKWMADPEFREAYKKADAEYAPVESPILEAWSRDCLRTHGRVLTGRFAHWCMDFDCLPVDETTPEWECCNCFKEPQE